MPADQNQALPLYVDSCDVFMNISDFCRSTPAGGICPVEPCDSATPAAKGAAGRQSGEWSGLTGFTLGEMGVFFFLLSVTQTENSN